VVSVEVPGLVKLFLCGDVMLGRGVDQILGTPGSPRLYESFVRDARDYVALAEAATGPIPRPVDDGWPWGEALEVLDAAAVDARIVNLETSVTRSDEVEHGKAVNYRMSPGNVGSLLAVRPDVCVLANNHVLDFGRSGLAETLDVLSRAGLTTAGAGTDLAEARRPAVVPLGAGRLVVVGVATASSGVPPTWGATPARSGVNLVSLTERGAAEVLASLPQHRRAGDVVVVSIHWGSNWGLEIPEEQVRFAHALIDGGVDVVHGHSSHHPRPVEVYRGRLVLYGCGDLVNDYEGISGHEAYRSDLRPLYLASIDAASGALAALEVVPMQARQMRLVHASASDVQWLAETLTNRGRPIASALRATDSGRLVLEGPGHGGGRRP
jgi:poly-gamma-glutamate capsule biosynthesis protein CapA/YwtB (metallophosphatase superfamily)